MIKRYTASADTTITNAFRSNLLERGVKGNMGESDSLEIFNIYAQSTTSSIEQSRILVDFDIDKIQNERTQGKIPDAGSVSFYLKMFNVKHSQTLPRQFEILVLPISSSWSEGVGLDMEEYRDVDSANWLSSSSGVLWTTEGGDFITGSIYGLTASFNRGYEDLELDVTTTVEAWLDGTNQSYGFGLVLPSSIESGSVSHYTKKFSARGSEFFYKKPTLELRWDNSRKDNRNNFFLSSSLVPAADNLNSLWLYNRNRKGQLVNIPAIGTGSIYLSVFTSASAGASLPVTPFSPITASWVETGVYSASVACYYTGSTDQNLYDIWFSGSLTFHTGTLSIARDDFSTDWAYLTSMPKLKSIYNIDEKAKFEVHTRKKNYVPTVYSVANTFVQTDIIEDLYYKVCRDVDDFTVVDYNTASNATLMSYNNSGSYCSINMDLFEPGYMYYLKFMHKVDGDQRELRQKFKFRVEKNDEDS